ATFFLKIDKSTGENEDTSLGDEIGDMLGVSKETSQSAETETQKTNAGHNPNEKVYKTEEIDLIVFACDAGIGSSAMGAGIVKKKLKDAGLNIKVENHAVDSLSKDVKLVVTHKNLYNRATNAAPEAVIRTVE